MMKTKLGRKQGSKRDQGQVLIIVVFSMVTLVAFAGLVVDTGLVFIGYGGLRRSVDAAALAAAAQYRKHPDPTGLSKAAAEFLVLNGVPIRAPRYACAIRRFRAYHDETLCTEPAWRRLRQGGCQQQYPTRFPTRDRDQ